MNLNESKMLRFIGTKRNIENSFDTGFQLDSADNLCLLVDEDMVLRNQNLYRHTLIFARIAPKRNQIRRNQTNDRISLQVKDAAGQC